MDQGVDTKAIVGCIKRLQLMVRKCKEENKLLDLSVRGISKPHENKSDQLKQYNISRKS